VAETKDKLAGLLPDGMEKRAVQQTFRLGYAVSEGEHSNRRPLEEVLAKY
jgi:hypothetical protein